MLKQCLCIQKQSRIYSLQLILVFFFCWNLHSQIQLCQNIYVWDFKSNDLNTNIVKQLTDEVEDILSEIDSCIVLQRRKYADIREQVKNEISILDLEGMPENLKEKFKLISAEKVVFGTISVDFNFNVNLRIRIESLLKKEVKTRTIFIASKDFISQESRKKIIKNKLLDILNIQTSDSIGDKSDLNITIEEDQINQLVLILDFRAQKIKNDLSAKYHFINTKQVLEEFEFLHHKHITALREGNLILAHEILKEIYSLSEKLETEEFNTVSYIYCFGCRYSIIDEYFLYPDLLFESGHDWISTDISFSETQKNVLKELLSQIFVQVEKKFSSDKSLQNLIKTLHFKHLEAIDNENIFKVYSALEEIQSIEREKSVSIDYKVKGTYFELYLKSMQSEIEEKRRKEDLENYWRDLYYEEIRSKDKFKNGILRNSYLFGVFERRINKEVPFHTLDIYFSIIEK